MAHNRTTIVKSRSRLGIVRRPIVKAASTRGKPCPRTSESNWRRKYQIINARAVLDALAPGESGGPKDGWRAVIRLVRAAGTGYDGLATIVAPLSAYIGPGLVRLND